MQCPSRLGGPRGAIAALLGALAFAGVFSADDETAAPVSQPTDRAQQFGPVGTTETVPFPETLAAGAAFQAAGNEVEGQTYSCGVVVVPENHDKPDGRTMELFYLKLHSRTQPAAATPMVYLAGGPGGSGSYELTANPYLNQNLDRIRQTRDIIAYDRRCGRKAGATGLKRFQSLRLGGPRHSSTCRAWRCFSTVKPTNHFGSLHEHPFEDRSRPDHYGGPAEPRIRGRRGEPFQE